MRRPIGRGDFGAVHPAGQWIYVGFEPGGDVRGALNAGLNVVAIENDPDQYAATVSNMRLFVPPPT